MSTLLVRNARVLVTMDVKRREISNGGLFIRDGWIEQVGDSAILPDNADEIVDLSGHIVLPGLVNAHHHLSQSLDRAYPPSQNASLVNWLKGLYSRWEHMSAEDVSIATEIGLAELALSGCTLVADHQYLWPKGVTPAEQFAAAARIGVRFHLGRGSQNIGVAQGGFAPPSLVEDEDDILSHTAETIDRFHDSSPGSLRQVFVAPSSLRSATPSLLRRSAELADKHKVRFHFHLGETRQEIDFTRQQFGKRPTEIAEELGCLTSHGWLAHGVHFDDGDVTRLVRCSCGICHCPSSNMRLASGVAPVAKYLERGLKIGLGVDGSASNDSSNLLSEARMALLLARVNATDDTQFIKARTVIEMATRNGAEILGRSDVGVLAAGFAADFVAIDSNRIEILGSVDPVAAIVFCAMTRVDFSWVHGKPVVQGGALRNFNMQMLADRCRQRTALTGLF
jgi:8-oxoguanine deaminase